MQLVSKAERQAHPWEAELDNKKASLKVNERKKEIFFISPSQWYGQQRSPLSQTPFWIFLLSDSEIIEDKMPG